MGKVSYNNTEILKHALEKLPDLPGYSVSCETRSELNVVNAVNAVNKNRKYRIMIVATDQIGND